MPAGTMTARRALLRWLVMPATASFSLAATPRCSAIASTSTGSGTVYTASADISDLQPAVPPGTPVPYVPQSQTFALANNATRDLMQWTVTGQTDSPLPPFALIATSRTYGSSPAIQGPVAFFGYNAAMPIGGGTNGHGAATLSFFADAGDTNSSGAHGIEANLSFFAANDSLATGAFQMVAVDDNTNTVNTTIRCGSGSSGSYTSNIVFQNGNASTTFLVMSNSRRIAIFEVPAVFSGGIRPPLTLSTNAASTPAALTLSALGSSSTATVTLEGNNGSAANSIIAFNTNGAVQWQFEHSPPYLYLKDTVNNRSAFYFSPGSTASNSKFKVLSVLQSSSSIVCGAAAIATTATDGFLYLPSCAGAPTGTPTTQTGTVPCVFDTTDGKLYFYTGGAWVGLAD